MGRRALLFIDSGSILAVDAVQRHYKAYQTASVVNAFAACAYLSLPASACHPFTLNPSLSSIYLIDPKTLNPSFSSSYDLPTSLCPFSFSKATAPHRLTCRLVLKDGASAELNTDAFADIY